MTTSFQRTFQGINFDIIEMNSDDIPYEHIGSIENIEINVRKDKQDESRGNGLFI